MGTATFTGTTFQKVMKLNLTLANTGKVIRATVNNTHIEQGFGFFCTDYLAVDIDIVFDR